MGIETSALMINAGILLLIVLIQGGYTDIVMGFKYAVGNREKPIEKNLFYGRVVRLRNNQIENLLIFTALVVVASLEQISNNATVSASFIFTGSRILFFISYLFGLKLVRSIIWIGGLIGLCIFGYGIISY